VQGARPDASAKWRLYGRMHSGAIQKGSRIVRRVPAVRVSRAGTLSLAARVHGNGDHADRHSYREG